MFWFLLATALIVPVIMIASGRFMWRHAPQNINCVIGYRTPRSMKNLDTWRFAHEYCGKLWWKLGWITLVPSALAMLPFYGASSDAQGIASVVILTVQMIVLIASIFPTEAALKRTFEKDGTRKEGC